MLSVAGNFIVPQANATPTLQSGIVEVYTFSGDLKGVDVTSNGTVFALVDSDVFCSFDNGVSWVKKLDNTGTISVVRLIRVDSQNHVFVALSNGSGAYYHNSIFRSTNYGVAWTKLLDDIPLIWRLAEMNNGTLLMNTYSLNINSLIYKSDNGGSTWSVWQNLTSWGNGHIHFVRVNPYNNDIWVGLGDKSLSNVPTIARWESGTSSWTIIYNSTTDWMYTDAIFDATHVYLLPDRSSYSIQKLPHRGAWADKVAVMDLYSDDTTSPTGIPYSMMGAVYDDGLMLVPTDRETVYASVDGVRWLKIFQTTYSGSGAWRLDYISQRRDSNGYWYFINDYTNKVYRASINADDIRKVLSQKYNTALGTIANDKVIIPVENNTRISINLTNSLASKFVVSMVGLTKGNLLENPSFETGDLTGWNIKMIQKQEIPSQDVVLCGSAPPEGSPLILASTNSSILFYDTTNDGYWSVGEPAIYDMDSDYNYTQGIDVVLIGSTPPDLVYLSSPFLTESFFDSNENTYWDIGEPAINDLNSDGFYNTLPIYPTYSVITSDKKFGSYALRIVTSTKDMYQLILETKVSRRLYGYAEYWFMLGWFKSNASSSGGYMKLGHYTDATTFSADKTTHISFTTSWQKVTSTALRSTSSKDFYLRVEIPWGYDKAYYIDGLLLERKVGNYYISKVNDGNTLVYKADKSTPTLSSDFYDTNDETKDVQISISGYPAMTYSGNMSEGSSFHHEYTQTSKIFDIYVLIGGSKQVLLIISYGTEPYVIVTDAQLISQSYSDNKFTFTVSATSGQTSTTKIYVGDKGQPKDVIGAASWSYNASTKILTVIAVHSSSTIIIVKWKLPGDINDDSAVNATDLSLLGNAYGSTDEPPPNANWNPEADLNGDNIIDLLDLAIIGENYGKTEN